MKNSSKISESMDGECVRRYWSSEVKAILDTYRQFEILIPSSQEKKSIGKNEVTTHAGSDHNGEDGRFVEELLREYLKRFLPKGLEVLTGFILRPAVKTGKKGEERRGQTDQHSTQLDIIIFDSENYPIFQRFGNSVIVPPEGVIAVISVKKHLRYDDIQVECENLFKVSELCSDNYNNHNEKLRGPYLALLSMNLSNSDKLNTKLVFDKINGYYKSKGNVAFDSLIGFIGTLRNGGIFKRRPPKNGKNININGIATYVGFDYRKDEEHFGLQLVLTGILSVFYDNTRRNLRRPGYTAFESDRSHDMELGKIPFSKIR